MENLEKSLLELSPLGIIITDKNTRITWCNARFLADTGFSKEKVINQLFASLPIEGSGFSNDPNKSLSLQLFDTDDQLRKSFSYWQADGQVDENEQRFHYFILQQGASETPKIRVNTTLPKRASWVEFLDYEVSRSRRYQNPLSVMKCHLLVAENPDKISDEAIQSCIKNSLMDELRWADMIGNTHQGSYLMVLPETPPESTEALEKKLMQAVNQELNDLSSKLKTTLVFGTAHWEKHDDSPILLEKARSSLVKQLETLIP